MDRALLLKAIDYGRYECITESAALDRWIAAAQEAGMLGLSIETDSIDPMQRALCSGSRSQSARKRPATFRSAIAPSGGLELAGSAPPQLQEKDALARLAPLFEDESILKIGHNLKYAIPCFCASARHSPESL